MAKHCGLLHVPGSMTVVAGMLLLLLQAMPALSQDTAGTNENGLQSNGCNCASCTKLHPETSLLERPHGPREQCTVDQQGAANVPEEFSVPPWSSCAYCYRCFLRDYCGDIYASPNVPDPTRGSYFQAIEWGLAQVTGYPVDPKFPWPPTRFTMGGSETGPFLLMPGQDGLLDDARDDLQYNFRKEDPWRTTQYINAPWPLTSVREFIDANGARRGVAIDYYYDSEGKPKKPHTITDTDGNGSLLPGYGWRYTLSAPGVNPETEMLSFYTAGATWANYERITRTRDSGGGAVPTMIERNVGFPSTESWKVIKRCYRKLATSGRALGKPLYIMCNGNAQFWVAKHIALGDFTESLRPTDDEWKEYAESAIEYDPDTGMVSSVTRRSGCCGGSVANRARYTYSMRDMVGWWGLDEAGGLKVRDLSGKGNNAILPVSVTWQAGMRHGGIVFDGTDNQYAACDVDNALGSTDKLAVAAWIKPSSSYMYSNQVVVGKVDSAAGYKLQRLTNGNYRFDVYIENGWKYSSEVAVSENCWTHLTGVYDGATIRIYKNGQEVGSGVAQSGSIVATTNYLKIGMGLAQTNFAGMIDDVRVYRGALAPQEVLRLAGNQVGHWAMNDSSRPGVDSSSNLNNGTLNSGASWTSAGKLGGAVAFDGVSGSILCGSGSSLNPICGLSIAAWIKESDTPNDGQAIVKKASASYGYSLERVAGTSQYKMLVRIGGQWCASNAVTVMAGEWTGLAGVYDGQNIHIYKNGTEVGTPIAQTGGIETDSSVLSIGSNSTSNGQFFKGTVDDVQVFTYPLSADGVVKLAGGDPNGDKAANSKKWVQKRVVNDRRVTTQPSVTEHEGTATTLYFNSAGDVIHKTVSDYADTVSTPVRTLEYHYEYNGAGNLVKEYSPSVCAPPFSAGESGSLSYTAKTLSACGDDEGLIRIYEYSTDGNGLLLKEKIQQGSDGTPITLVAYEYFTGLSRKDLLKKVTRYAEENETDGEVTEYDYDADGSGTVTGDDFYDGSMLVPKQKKTTVTLSVSPAKSLVTLERYNGDGSVQFRKDAYGSVTFYQYSSSGPTTGKPLYEVQDINTSGSFSNYPVDFALPTIPSGFAMSAGLNLTTRYEYNSQGELYKVSRVSGVSGQSLVWESSYYVKAYPENVIVGNTNDSTAVEYERLEESRVYPHVDGSGTVYGPIQVTLSIPGGATVSARTARIDSWASQYTPGSGDSLIDLTRTDNIYYPSGQLHYQRVFYKEGDFDSNDATTYLQTKYTYDTFGRLQQAEDPEGTITYQTYGWYPYATGKYCKEDRVYTVYDDGSTWSLEAPVQVSWTDWASRPIRSARATCTLGGEPSGSETVTEVSRSATLYDWRGRTSLSRDYFNLGTLTRTQEGTKGTNYYERQYLAYDNQDRLLRQQDGMDNISATVYDAAGRVLTRWQGLNLGSAPTRTDPNGGGSGGDMRVVGVSFYDSDRDGTGDPKSYRTASGSVKALYSLTADPTTNSYADLAFTNYYYDTAGRGSYVVGPDPGTGSIKQVQTLDGIGRTTLACTKKVDDTLLAQAESVYDAGGRLTATRQYEVSSGTAGSYLETVYWYDDAGRQCKAFYPSGQFVKTQYDPVGRTTGTFVCSSEGNDTSPQSLADDIVLQESVYTYDGVGNVIFAASYARNHDETAKTGDLATSWSEGDSRASYLARWYDHAHRLTYSADYGTNDGTEMTERPTGSPPEPNSSSDVIVAKTSYGSDGMSVATWDNLAIRTNRDFDALGRLTKVTENYVDGTPSGTTDRITLYEYNAGGQITTQTAFDIACDGDTSGHQSDNQVTQYVYSGALTDKGCPVKSNSLLRGIIYPDSDNSVSSGSFSDGSGYDRVEMTYLANGSLYTREDQRQVTLTFSYDDAGRMTEQAVTGTADGDQQVKYTFNDLGLPEKFTAYSTADTTISSEVKLKYNGLGQLTQEFQDHDSAVAESGSGASLSLQYAYDTTASSGKYTKGMRRTYMTLPNTRQIHHLYNGHNGVDDAIGRTNQLATGSGGTAGDVIAEYQYTGDGRTVVKDYGVPASGPDVRLTYAITSGTNPYAGFDRFGRIAEQRWENYFGSPVATVFDVKHGYDNASDRIWDDDQQYKGNSQAFSYDDLHRLTDAKRGKMDTAKTGTTYHPTYAGLDWTLDQLGNWKTYDNQAPEANSNVTIERTFNNANEINTPQSITATSGVRYGVKDEDFANLADNYAQANSNDAWAVSNGELNASTVASSPAILLVGGSNSDTTACPYFSGNAARWTSVYMPATATKAGIVFGYKSATDYWVLALNSSTGREELYQKSGANFTLRAYTSRTITTGQYNDLALDCRSGSCLSAGGYNFASKGSPDGAIGFYAERTDVKFDYLRSKSVSNTREVLNRWICAAGGLTLESGPYLHLTADKPNAPILRKGLHLGEHQAEFRFRTGSGTGSFRYVFWAQDTNNYYAVEIPYGTADYVRLKQVALGGADSELATSGSTITPTANTWYRARVTVNDYDVKVEVSDDSPVNYSTQLETNSDLLAYWYGGLVGFAVTQGDAGFDDITIRTDSSGGTNFSQTECSEDCSASSSVSYDLAGNMTRDGVNSYVYDAWNRLVKVKRAGSTDGSGNETLIGVIAYDGLGRRISKAISNSSDWNCTYHYYYDGQRTVEVRNGSDRVLQQYVWGLDYVDELLQTGVNQDPADTAETNGGACERFFWACQDANYNVMGIVSEKGLLVERYEYTPYGQRTVFSRPWFLCDVAGDGLVMFSDYQTVEAQWGSGDPNNRCDLNGDGQVGFADYQMVEAGMGRSYSTNNSIMLDAVVESCRGYGTSWSYQVTVGTCDIGHQGLMYDREFGVYNNRARIYNPRMGRFNQWDPMGTPIEPTMARTFSGPTFTQPDQLGTQMPIGSSKEIPGAAAPLATGAFAVDMVDMLEQEWSNPELSSEISPSAPPVLILPRQYSDGMNLCEYTRSNPLGRQDPNGTNIYLKTGNNTWNPINNAVHQNVCVDNHCKGKDKTLSCFSFAKTGWAWYGAKTKWLGWDSVTLPGYLMEGTVYSADDTGEVVKTKTTTQDQDLRWLLYMITKRLNLKDVYSVVRHNCRMYAQLEFAEAPGNH